jgi:hypothetical protein
MNPHKIFIFILLLVFQLLNEAYAQESAQISYQEFKTITLNNQITLDDLILLDGNWEQLKTALGQPINQECVEKDPFLGFDEYCEFHYDGLKIYYIDVGNGAELAKISLTNQSVYLTYQNVEIRTGYPVSVLQPLFPQAYHQRGAVSSGGETRYFIQLNVNQSITYLSFQYNPANNTIVEISLIQILM